VVLTELGIQHLETRLSRAVEHKTAFLEMLDEEKSLAASSNEWRLLWEDATSLPARPVAIDAKVDAWLILNFRDHSSQGRLDLNPTYQRDVVWTPSESRLLIESVLRGIPLPSVILSQGRKTLQIVDGKQRLTAILRFMGHHPQGRAIAATMEGGLELCDNDFRKFAARNQLRRDRDLAERLLPFKLGKYKDPNDPLFPVSGRYYSEIRHIPIKIGDAEMTVFDIFENSMSDYKIPVILYRNTQLRDIHHVFSLYNKQGKKLNAEELRNAIYHHLDLTKLLLVMSGDRPEPDLLAPYLPPDVVEQISEVGRTLEDKGFGTVRFKRTKVLSWVCSMLLVPPREGADGRFSTPSTASHINALLEAVNQGDREHALFQRTALVALARDIQSAVLLHEDVGAAWHPKFRTKKNDQGMASKWEELPLVASLLASLVIVAGGWEDLLREGIGDLRELTQGWRGPESTQNKTQWKHIASVAVGILDALGLQDSDIDPVLTQRYGYSCAPTLRRIATQD